MCLPHGTIFQPRGGEFSCATKRNAWPFTTMAWWNLAALMWELRISKRHERTDGKMQMQLLWSSQQSVCASLGPLGFGKDYCSLIHTLQLLGLKVLVRAGGAGAWQIF